MGKNILEMHVPFCREIYTAPQSESRLFLDQILTTHQDMCMLMLRNACQICTTLSLSRLYCFVALEYYFYKNI